MLYTRVSKIGSSHPTFISQARVLTRFTMATENGGHR